MHVDAGAERVLLRSHADAAEDRGGGDRRVHRELLELLQNLRRELARRREDERARRAARTLEQVDEEWEEGTRRSFRFRSARRRARRDPRSRREWRRFEWASAERTELLDAAKEIAVQLEEL